MARILAVLSAVAFAVLVSGCSLVYDLAALAQGPAYEAKPIPAGPDAHTARAFSDLVLQFNLRTMVDAYRQVGRKNPAWDEEAVAFLTACARSFAEMPDSPSDEELLRQAAHLQELGCDDPLVIYCCGAAAYANQKIPEAIRLLERASRELPRTSYPPVWSAFAAMSLAHVLQENPRPGMTMPEVYWNQAVKWIDETLKRGTYREGEERLILSMVRRGWDQMPLGSRRLLAAAFSRSGERYPYAQDVVKGMIEVDEAWEGRGGDAPSQVTEEGWQRFFAHLDRASGVLTRAWRRHPEYPEAPALMMAVAMAGRGGLQAGRLWFDRTVAAQMDYLPAYQDMLWYLRPRWHGDHRMMYEFGVECLETGRFDTMVPFQFLRALSEITDDLGGAKAHWKGRDTRERLDRMFRGYATQGPANKRAWFQSAQAAVAWYLGDYAAARRLLDQMGDRVVKRAFLESVGAEPWEVMGQTYLFTGEHGKAAQEAEAAYCRGEYEKAADAYESLLEGNPRDPEVREYLRRRIAEARWHQRFAAGEWVDLCQERDLSHWECQKGSWAVSEDGSIVGLSVGHGLWAVYTEDVGPRYEVRGEMALLASQAEEPPNCGVLLNCAPEEDWDFLAWLVSEREQQAMLSHAFKEDESVFEKAEVHANNVFHVQVWDNTVTGYLNGKLIHRAVKLKGPSTRGKLMVGIGSWCSHPGTLVQYRKLQIRRLTTPPAKPTGRSPEVEHGGTRS